MARDDFPKTKTMEGHEGVDTSSSGGDGTVITAPVIYYAYCSSPSHQGAWTGQDWSVKADAQRDCDDHNTQCDTQGASVHIRSA